MKALVRKTHEWHPDECGRETDNHCRRRRRKASVRSCKGRTVTTTTEPTRTNKIFDVADLLGDRHAFYITKVGGKQTKGASHVLALTDIVTSWLGCHRREPQSRASTRQASRRAVSRYFTRDALTSDMSRRRIMEPAAPAATEHSWAWASGQHGGSMLCSPHPKTPSPSFSFSLYPSKHHESGSRNGISVYSVELFLHVQMSEGFIIVPR